MLHAFVLLFLWFINQVPRVQEQYVWQQSTITSTDCEKYVDCFSCSAQFGYSNSCKWDNINNSCDYSDINVNSKKWYELFELCEQETNQSETILINSCVGYKSSSLPFQARINTDYIRDHIYCYWKFNELARNSQIEINLLKEHSDVDNDFYFWTYRSINNSMKESFWTQESLNVSINVTDHTIFRFYRRKYTKDNPFVLTINYKEDPFSFRYLLIVISGLTVVFFILLVIWIYRNKRKSNDTTNVHSTDEKKNTEINANILKIEELFETKYLPIWYEKQLNDFATNCTICLDNFNYSVEVVKLNCHHIFHVKCIQKWCYNNILSPKCPNCNIDILENSNNDKGEGEGDDEEYNDNNNNNNNNNNRDKNDDNNSGNNNQGNIILTNQEHSISNIANNRIFIHSNIRKMRFNTIINEVEPIPQNRNDDGDVHVDDNHTDRKANTSQSQDKDNQITITKNNRDTWKDKNNRHCEEVGMIINNINIESQRYQEPQEITMSNTRGCTGAIIPKLKETTSNHKTKWLKRSAFDADTPRWNINSNNALSLELNEVVIKKNRKVRNKDKIMKNKWKDWSECQGDDVNSSRIMNS